MSYVPRFEDLLDSSSKLQEYIYNSYLKRLQVHYEKELKDRWQEDDFRQQFLTQRILPFFYPDYFLLHSPFHLPDVEKAIALLQRAFLEKNDHKILIYGDRDVDGITSSTILYLFLTQEMGFDKNNVTVLLPREEDKYGITEEVATRILQHDFQLLITLDCGSANKASIDAIKKQNTRASVIVIDHHFIPQDQREFPQVEAFINPKRLDFLFVEREFCTALLVFKFLEALIFSYTSEYDKVYALSPTLRFKNGVSYEVTSSNDHFNISEEAGVDIINNSLYKMIQTDKRLSDFLNFCQRNQITLDSAKKLRIIQISLLGNVKQKLKKFLPFAAIGTIGDMMPLLHDNRIMVRLGLEFISENFSEVSLGLKSLLTEYDFGGKKIKEQDVGFTLAPALNSAGRLGNAMAAFSLLIEQDPLVALKKSKALREINDSRKELSAQAAGFLVTEIDKQQDKSLLVIADDRIHRGISGLIANKLTEVAKKPVIVIVHDGDCLRGSARAYQNENVFSIVDHCSSLLIQYGGHRQASGFSIMPENLAEFTRRAQQYYQQKILQGEESYVDFYEFEPFVLPEKEIDETLWLEIEKFAPYGVLNPHPIIQIQSDGDIEYKHLGKSGDHLRVDFLSITHSQIEGVWFFHNGQAKVFHDAEKVSVLAEPHKNYFMGKVKLQLKIKNVLAQSSTNV